MAAPLPVGKILVGAFLVSLVESQGVRPRAGDSGDADRGVYAVLALRQ